MFLRFLSLTALLLFCTGGLRSQDTVRVMTYNLLRYYPSDNSRDQFFRTVVRSVNPDILVVQEIDTAAAVLGFLTKVMNDAGSTEYSAGVFIDGYDSDNAVFLKSGKFSFVENKPIRTRLRDINQFTLLHQATGRSLIVFSVHLKAGNSVTPEADSTRRSEEVDSLLAATNLLPAGTDFVVAGDFNIYGSMESAYQKLVSSVCQGGFVVDPLVMSGVWNDPVYAPFHTQSTRVRSFGFGATGGLDDRFDMILVSQAVKDPGGIWLLPGSYAAWGNDGQHYNDSINRLPNAAVADSVAMALHEASDHLPVVVKLVLEDPPVRAENLQRINPESFLVNFPNPFNPTTEISYYVHEAGQVDLRVFDILGREIAVLVNDRKLPGTYTVLWHAVHQPGGIYFCRMRSGFSEETRKMILAK